MNNYLIYADGVYFATKEAKNEEDAIKKAKDQIKQLHPINMSEEGAKNYRKRFENSIITAKKRGY